jgi:iron complex outermembrane receptor protein
MTAKSRNSGSQWLQPATCSSIVFSLIFATGSYAQTTSDQTAGLAEIVVTAQKREQTLQDVPIAITAITSDELQSNRVTQVTDLSGLAPNMIVRPSAGGVGIPAFSMRGVTSYGVVPGSDKETSIYLDGVYIGGTEASTFELPDIERIEVLRGPQGTLFGRNSTAGAVSVVTRNPSGEFKVTQEVTAGNFKQFRSRTSVDLPAWGPFSAYVTYVHDERRGDILNTGAGTVWDRSGPATGLGVQDSPKYLGDKSVNSWFAAVKFEPNANFRTTYKFDYAVNHFTPEGQAAIGINTNYPLIGPLLGAVSGNAVFDPSATRPGAVNDAFAAPGLQRNAGHNLTSELTLSDNMSVKNIASFRESSIRVSTQLDGLGGLTLTPNAVVPYATLAAFTAYPTNVAAALAAIPGYAAFFGSQVGSRFVAFGNNSQSSDEQWSDEFQFNYTSRLLTLTAGAIFYHQQDVAGGPPGMVTTTSFLLVPPDGRIPLGNEGYSYNEQRSLAGYTQAEVHLTPVLDLVAGVRVTRDNKSGIFDSGGIYIPGPGGSFTTGSFTGEVGEPFTYHETKPTYSGGLNYTPVEDVLVYGKYSTGFVSGGAIGGIAFQPETVESTEAGIKTEFLRHRLRADLALFSATYQHLQSAQGGDNVGHPELGTVIIDQGSAKAKGFEFEGSALPFTGVTLTASVGYTDLYYGTVNPILTASYGGVYEPELIPKWTAGLSGSYESNPLFDTARLFFRTDANWRAAERTIPNPALATEIPALAALAYSPAGWIVNARLALREIKMGSVTGEVALWGRNITNNKETLFPLLFSSIAGSSDFQPAPTYGVDFTISF